MSKVVPNESANKVVHDQSQDNLVAEAKEETPQPVQEIELTEQSPEEAGHAEGVDHYTPGTYTQHHKERVKARNAVIKEVLGQKSNDDIKQALLTGRLVSLNPEGFENVQKSI